MKLWNQYLLSKETELGKNTVDHWLRTLKVLNFDAANLYLEAKDSFQAQWFSEYIRPSLKNEFCNENNKPIKVHLQISNKIPLNRKKQSEDNQSAYHPVIDEVDPQNTLGDFLEFDQNRVIFRLFSEFQNYTKVKTPIYNPIYLHSAEGMGKTHLLQALYHLLSQQNIKVAYVRAQTFTENMVKAIKAGLMSDFRKFYRENDVLLIDDIHQFSQKTATQEEFFHTFNTLHLGGKQIILTANSTPQQLESIEPRLISRFEWGIVLPIKPPTEAQLKKILDKKLKQLNFSLEPSVKEFLIKKFAENPKILQKAISALILRAHLKLPQWKKVKSFQLGLDSAKQLIGDLIVEQEKEIIDEDKILSTVARYFEIRVEDILGKSQSRESALPRQIAMYFCRECLKLPFMKIGRIFSRDHSTVMSSVKQINKSLINTSQESARAVQALEKLISA